MALEISVRSTALIKSLTLVSAAGIHVAGVPKGDIFLWDDDERVYNTFFDPKFAEVRLAREPSEEDRDIALKNHFSTAKLSWHPRFYNPELQKWLHRVDVPTLILWGDSDKVFPPEYTHDSVASCGTSRILRTEPNVVELNHPPLQDSTR